MKSEVQINSLIVLFLGPKRSENGKHTMTVALESTHLVFPLLLPPLLPSSPSSSKQQQLDNPFNSAIMVVVLKEQTLGERIP
jgi:hypothetical protein